MNFLGLILSFLFAYGLAVAFVEKGKDWPIKPIRVRLQLILSKIHWKLPQMLFCTTCTSFWTSLVADITICCLFLCLGNFYFLWPISGFINMGITWTIIEFLNAVDNDIIINNT